MSLGERQNQVPYIGTGVFLTSLFLYVIIFDVGLAGKTPQGLCLLLASALCPARNAYR